MKDVAPPLPKILFVCTGNSCRSQMAEAWMRILRNNVFSPHSAGIAAHGLDPHAVKVMAEEGIDISGHCSKPIDDFSGVAFDCIITLSERARTHLPRAPHTAATLHAGFNAPRRRPATFPKNDGLDEYRHVRDQIRTFVTAL